MLNIPAEGYATGAFDNFNRSIFQQEHFIILTAVFDNNKIKILQINIMFYIP